MKPTLAAKPIVIRLATETDRAQIYWLRHDIYARELGQHASNSAGQLSDTIDGLNVYLVASRNGDIAGFISITPPAGGRFSVDKYVRRHVTRKPIACAKTWMRNFPDLTAEKFYPGSPIFSSAICPRPVRPRPRSWRNAGPKVSFSGMRAPWVEVLALTHCALL